MRPDSNMLCSGHSVPLRHVACKFSLAGKSSDLLTLKSGPGRPAFLNSRMRKGCNVSERCRKPNVRSLSLRAIETKKKFKTALQVL